MKILIADDSETTRAWLQAVLPKWGYEVSAAATGTEAARIFQAEDGPRLAVLDWLMPGIDGIELCRELRTRPPEAYVYIILLTARGRTEDIITGLEAGADEYLVKPFDEHELKARLNTGRRIIDLQEKLLAAATHDSLTGLWTHGAIIDLVGKELARGRRNGQPVAIIMSDIDRFKDVNDTYGHLAGDGVLREVASRLRASLRPYDGIGRYGGEEFLVIVPECDGAGIFDLAERLRQSVAGKPFRVPAGEIPVTMSLGVAAVSGADMPTVESLLQVADEALYRAKAAGRNRVEMGSAPSPASTGR